MERNEGPLTPDERAEIAVRMRTLWAFGHGDGKKVVRRLLDALTATEQALAEARALLAGIDQHLHEKQGWEQEAGCWCGTCGRVRQMIRIGQSWGFEEEEPPAAGEEVKDAGAG